MTTGANELHKCTSSTYRQLCEERDEGLPHLPGVCAALDASAECLLRHNCLRRGEYSGGVDHSRADVLVEQTQSTGICLVRVETVAVVLEFEGLEELRQGDECVVRRLVLALQLGVGQGL